ncbi:hypothetical protein OROHE_008036 [Orobanche hederae]
MWYEERSNKTKRAINPTFSLCCQDGEVLFPKFSETPLPLKKLLDYTDPATSKLRDQIRVYNSMFCFTSFGAKIDHSVNTGRGPFRINGQNYHLRDWCNSHIQREQPKFAQLYFFDTQNEVKNQMSAFIGRETCEQVDGIIVTSLIAMLNQSSLVAKSFRSARDWCNSHILANFKLRRLVQRTSSRHYNMPTVSEVAALITNNFGEGIPSRYIVVSSNDTGPQRISKLHPVYMEKMGERLFQQYLVGAYTDIEEQRLQWTINNHNNLRVDIYHNLYDAVTRGDTNAMAIGNRIVLPLSYIGSPRYMMQNYQDAMALCRAFGNPDLFITFTSNLKWPEIAEMLAYVPGQKSHNRPEVGTRASKIKQNEMLDDFTKNLIFGECRAVQDVE